MQTMNSATLFIGDLSIFCTEQEIYKLFEPFGPIESIQLKRCEKKKPHLSYGFIKFAFHQSAEAALAKVNGSVFLGRSIRVGWALDNPAMKSSLMRQLETKNIKQTAQIHVTFTSRNPHNPVTENTLRQVFLQFGEVVDVTINKTMFSPDMRSQSGYGFVHYQLTDEGITSAMNAISSMHRVVVDQVTYECSVSHGLENYLNARRVQPGTSSVPIGPVNGKGTAMGPVIGRMIPTDDHSVAGSTLTSPTTLSSFSHSSSGSMSSSFTFPKNLPVTGAAGPSPPNSHKSSNDHLLDPFPRFDGIFVNNNNNNGSSAAQSNLTHFSPRAVSNVFPIETNHNNNINTRCSFPMTTTRKGDGNPLQTGQFPSQQQHQFILEQHQQQQRENYQSLPRESHSYNSYGSNTSSSHVGANHNHHNGTTQSQHPLSAFGFGSRNTTTSQYHNLSWNISF